MSISQRKYGVTADGQEVTLFTLLNQQGLEMKVINYGCTITSLKVPDRDGKSDDVVLGYNHLDGYQNSRHYMGAVIGRVANRIAGGKFSLDGKDFLLPQNQPPHHLHGGMRGFDKVIWTPTPFENEKGIGINFYYFSPEGEEGYPGNVHIYVRYFLSHENVVIFNFLAETDQPTILNLLQHSYFNLNGDRKDILNHELFIQANHYLPVDETLIPTGEVVSVKETPFDFTSIKSVGADIKSSDVQIRRAKGYDHNWVLLKQGEELAHAATLYEPVSGRVMEIHTTEPGLQVYTANFLDNKVPGKNKTRYGPFAGICLETQHFPDTPNHPNFPSVVLRPDKTYQSTTVLVFSSV